MSAQFQEVAWVAQGLRCSEVRIAPEVLRDVRAFVFGQEAAALAASGDRSEQAPGPDFHHQQN